MQPKFSARFNFSGYQISHAFEQTLWPEKKAGGIENQ